MPLVHLALAAACSAHPAYTLAAVVSHESVRGSDNRYRASAQVSFRVKTLRAARVPAGQPAWEAHARGHTIIAQRVAQAGAGSVEANGSTRAQALARLNQTVAQMLHDDRAELAREEHAYEDVTGGGRSQDQGPAYGFPGGRDADSPVCALP